MSRRTKGYLLGVVLFAVGLIIAVVGSYLAVQGTAAPLPGQPPSKPSAGEMLAPYLSWIGLFSAAIGLIKLAFETMQTIRGFFSHAPSKP